MESEFDAVTLEVLLKSIVDGSDAEDFYNSPIGRMLFERARKDVGKYLRAVLDDDTQTEQLAELRRKAVAARNTVHWISVQIVEGRNASQAYEASLK